VVRAGAALQGITTSVRAGEVTCVLGDNGAGTSTFIIAKARERGLGVVFITHNPHHAYPVGDRFMLLRRGDQPR
jgi:ABC-type sugar transport system ATPase subunit